MDKHAVTLSQAIEGYFIAARARRLSPHTLDDYGRTFTYFFSVERSRRLSHDFYLTRLWNRRTRHWQKVAILKPAFWDAINGDTRLSLLDQVLDVLPDVAEIRIATERLVVVDYQKWKDRVKVQQEGKQSWTNP